MTLRSTLQMQSRHASFYLPQVAALRPTKQTSRLSGVNAFQATGGRAREELRHRSGAAGKSCCTPCVRPRLK